MEKLTREQLVELVDRVVRADFEDEEEADRMNAQLVASTGGEYILELIFWPAKGDENLTPEQIVDKALQHKPKPPIAL